MISKSVKAKRRRHQGFYSKVTAACLAAPCGVHADLGHELYSFPRVLGVLHQKIVRSQGPADVARRLAELHAQKRFFYHDYPVARRIGRNAQDNPFNR